MKKRTIIYFRWKMQRKEMRQRHYGIMVPKNPTFAATSPLSLPEYWMPKRINPPQSIKLTAHMPGPIFFDYTEDGQARAYLTWDSYIKDRHPKTFEPLDTE